jgi:hypothetical protein
MVKVWLTLGIVVVLMTVYALVECVIFDRNRIRGLPRWVWIFVIVLVPVVGSLLWLIVGRGRSGAGGSRVMRSVAPDDDPDFLKSLGRDRLQEERIRQMEQELADLDKADPGKPDTRDHPAKGPAAAEPQKKTDPGEGELPGRRDA